MKSLKHVVKLVFLFLFSSPVIFGQDVLPVDVTVCRDSTILKGKFYKATGEGFFPALLLLPGFPGNETDVLGLGKRLAGKGINVMMINYSGTHQSQGLWGLNNVMSDISAANAFLHDPVNTGKFGIDTSQIILGGYSYGGGMALTYAIKHPKVVSIVSIAGNDWGEYFEDYITNPDMKAGVDAIVNQAISSGIVRPAPGEKPEEFLAEGTGSVDPELYVKRNADKLIGKSILLLVGWNDAGVVLERYTLPLYRALQKENAQHVSIEAFQDDHSFQNSRDQIAESIIRFINDR